MISQTRSMFQLTGCVSQLVVATVLVLDSNNMCTWQGEERRGEERRREEKRGEERREEKRRGEERRREAEEKAMIGEGPHLWSVKKLTVVGCSKTSTILFSDIGSCRGNADNLKVLTKVQFTNTVNTVPCSRTPINWNNVLSCVGTVISAGSTPGKVTINV